MGKDFLDSIDKVRKISRTQALIKVCQEREVKDRVRFVVRFDPRLTNFKQILRGSWSEDLAMTEIFPSPPMVCYQRVQSIGEMLVRARLPANRPASRTRSAGPDSGFKPCRQHNCLVCDHLEFKDRIISEITCSSAGEKVKIKDRITCNTTDFVYCITCKRAVEPARPTPSTLGRPAGR